MMLIPIRDRNPTHSFPIVTVVLIAINVAVFVMVGVEMHEVIRFGAVPCDVMGQCPGFSNDIDSEFPGRSSLLSVITSMFMHGGLLHIAFNMLFLWVFGNNVEDRMGSVRYVVFYLLCGLVAAAAHILVFADSNVPVVGASGAVSGVLGAYLVLFPHARVMSIVPIFFFFQVIEVSAKVLLIIWFVMQVVGGVAGFGAVQGGGGGTAFLAHIGGFVAGWLLVRLFVAGRPARPAHELDWR